MPFNYLLTNLLVDVPGSVGAIFADYEGESIEWVTRHGDPYDLKVEGAYHSIFLRLMTESLERIQGGVLDSYLITAENFCALTHVLPGHYYVVLVIDRSASVSRARFFLARVAELLAREVA